MPPSLIITFIFIVAGILAFTFTFTCVSLLRKFLRTPRSLTCSHVFWVFFPRRPYTADRCKWYPFKYPFKVCLSFLCVLWCYKVNLCSWMIIHYGQVSAFASFETHCLFLYSRPPNWDQVMTKTRVYRDWVKAKTLRGWDQNQDQNQGRTRPGLE